MRNRVIAYMLIFSIAAGLVPGIAMAGENDAKKAAIGATAITAYLLSQHGTRSAGWLGAAGSAYLWKKYHDSRSARRHHELAREHRTRRQASYWRSRYRAERRHVVRAKRTAHR